MVQRSELPFEQNRQMKTGRRADEANSLKLGACGDFWVWFSVLMLFAVITLGLHTLVCCDDVAKNTQLPTANPQAS